MGFYIGVEAEGGLTEAEIRFAEYGSKKVTRNGKRLHNYGKIHHFLNGKTHYNYFYMIIFNGYVSEYQNVSSPKSYLKATQKITDEIMSFIERNISGVAKYPRILTALGLSIHL